MGRKSLRRLQDALITNEFFGQGAESGCPFGCCRVHGSRAPAAKPNQFPTLDHDIVGAAALVRFSRTSVLSRCSPGVSIEREIFAAEASKRMKTIRRERSVPERESNADCRGANRSSIK